MVRQYVFANAFKLIASAINEKALRIDKISHLKPLMFAMMLLITVKAFLLLQTNNVKRCNIIVKPAYKISIN